ncbi:hypothetical protein DMENIID0001_101620 [Sergentomyia squamirostris]
MFHKYKTPASRYSVKRRQKFSSLLSKCKFKKKQDVKMLLGIHNLKLHEAKMYWNVEYENDMYTAMKLSEGKKPVIGARDFSDLPHYHELRYCLLSLQKHITEHEHFSRNTLHLGMFLLDMFMHNFRVPDNKLYFIAGVCLILAAKVEDIDYKLPTIPNIDTYIGRRIPTKTEDYISIEFNIMRLLGFNLIIPTAITFLDYFACCVVTADDFNEQKKLAKFNFTSFEEYLQNAQDTALKFVDSILKDVSLVNDVLPSRVAAACILATRVYLHLPNPWPATLVRMTQYQMTDLMFYATRIRKLCDLTDTNSMAKDVCSPDSSGYRTADDSVLSDSDLSLHSDTSSDESMSIDE